MPQKKTLAFAGFLAAIVLTALGGIYYLSLYSGDAAQGMFLDEVKSAPRTSDKVEIHSLAAKYIPRGTSKVVALRFCEMNGFKMYPVREKRHFDPKKYDESIICSRRRLKWYLIGEEEIRIILDIKGDVVLDVRSYIFLHVW